MPTGTYIAISNLLVQFATLLIFYSLLRNFFKVTKSRIANVGFAQIVSYATVNSIFLIPIVPKLLFSLDRNLVRISFYLIFFIALYFVRTEFVALFSFIALSIPIHFFTFFTQSSSNDQLGLYTSIGSLHTGKYVYFADYLRFCQKLPTVHHNLAQSNYSAFISFISGTNLSLSLLTTLGIMKMALFFVVYGVALDNYGLNVKDSLIISSVVVAGSFSLSLAHLLLHDSGNPILLNGYSDVIYGVSVLFIGLKISNEWNHLSGTSVIVILVITFTTLFLASPQILMLLVPIIISLFLHREFRYQAIVFGSSLFIGGLFWRNQTGMFSSRSTSEFSFLPVAASRSWFSGELLSPGIPFMIGTPGQKVSEIDPKIIDLLKSAIAQQDISRSSWLLEIVLLIGLKVLFWPILGLLGSFVVLKRNPVEVIRVLPESLSLNVKKIAWLSILGFIFMSPISFLFKIGGMKWETTRFVFPSLVILMFAFVLLANYSLKRRRFLWNLSVALILIPSLLYSTEVVLYNLKNGVVVSSSSEYGRFSLFEKEFTVSDCS